MKKQAPSWRLKPESYKDFPCVHPNELDEPRVYYTEWSKSERERQILYMNARVWDLEGWYWWTYLRGSNGDNRHRAQTCGTVEEGEGGTDWENSMETYIIICKIDSKVEFAVQHKEFNPVLCDNLEGWDGEGSGRGFRREGTCVDLWLIHADVWQTLTQYCKAIILQ